MSCWQSGDVMTTVENNDLFEQYYQKEYDFNTESLSEDEIDSIKKLVKEKRVDYALAPMGTGVFSWIYKQNYDIQFELVSFDSEKLDGMLYIPKSGKEKAYIILNSNKPLANQIFTAAHEFYHYICDYQAFKEKPYICDFSMLKDVNEKKACRFAAELLLPEGALSQEIKDFCRTQKIDNIKKADFSAVAALLILLTIKYQMPLKAVIYRLYEENHIDNVERFIESYDFIKQVLQEIKICAKRVDELYSSENAYVLPYGFIYQNMEKAYEFGNASREDILRDAVELNLDMALISDFLDSADEYDEEDDNDDLFEIINSRQG